MAVRDGRGDVKQTTTGFRDPRHHICHKQIPIPYSLEEINVAIDQIIKGLETGRVLIKLSKYNN